MNGRKNVAMERWLAAETVGDDVRAETALTGLFAWIPRLAPAPGFVDRVLEVAPLAARGAVLAGRRAVPLMWAWRWSVATALALSGFAAWLLPTLRWVPFRLPGMSEIVKAVAEATGAAAEWLQTGLAVWGALQKIGGLALVAVQTPEVAAGMAGSAVVSAAALYTLNHLLTLERRSW